MDREILDQKELGSFVHDARTKLGLTQEALAERAGVSRKWLIGLEQGARTRAELGKVLDTLEALGISINLSFNTEPETESSEQDRYRSLVGISPAALDAIRKTSGFDQTSRSKLNTLNISQPAFKNLATAGLGESSFQKLAKDLGKRTSSQNFAAGLGQLSPLTSGIDSNAANDEEDHVGQTLRDSHDHNEDDDADDNNDQGLQ